MNLRRESKLACQRVLAYHKELVQVAKDKTVGSVVRSAKLDRLYRLMIEQVRRLGTSLDEGE